MEKSLVPAFILNKYQFDHEIGVGHFSRIYKATDKDSGLSTIIKFIKKNQIEDAKIKYNLACPDIDSENLMEINYVSEDDNLIVVISSNEPGENVLNYLNRLEIISEKVIQNIFRMILNGVRDCHNKSIIIGNIKYENVIIFSKNNKIKVKISDFFIINVLKMDQEYSSRLYTEMFSSPEFFMREEIVEKSDVWSIGVLLYCLLSGRKPFDGKEKLQLQQQISSGSYTLESDEWNYISEDAKDLIKKMLSVNIEERITVDQALNHPWITQEQSTEPLKYTKANLKLLSLARNTNISFYAAKSSHFFKDIAVYLQKF